MALPANVNKAPVHGKYVDFAGVACTGTITFVPSAYQTDPSADTVLLPLPTTVVLNLAGNGAYQTGPGEFLIGPNPAGLICTDDPDLSPGFYYHVIENFDGQNPIEYDLLVPVANSPSTNVELADVNRQLALIPAPQIYVNSVNGLSGNVTLSFAAPVVSAVGDTTGAGVATTYARSDHRHQREAFGNAVAQITYAQSASNGASTSVARADHLHGTVSLPTAAQVGALANSLGVTTFSAGLHSSRPAAGNSGAVWLSHDRQTIYRDNGTAWVAIDEYVPIPNYWTAFGHSYLAGTSATIDLAGRIDNFVKRLFGVEQDGWKNFAMSGSRICFQGANLAGWATMWREINKQPSKTYPYNAQGGGLLLMYGINDLGTMGGATAQNLGALGHAWRAMISRHRAARIFEDTDASIAYSGGWSNGTDIDHASNGTFKFRAGAVTGDTITITLPADYKGETVGLCFMGRPGTNGCTYTLSGTALVGNPANGTTVQTSDVMPALSFSHVPVVKRITGLSSANAGQTIIATITTNANEGQWDCYWLEALAPPPVIVADIARPTAAAIAGSYPGWAAVLGSHDNDIAAANTVLANVVAEFDSMVQVAFMDAALAKDNLNFFDGLHPNEVGAAKVADAINDARRRLQLVDSSKGLAAHFVPSAQRSGSRRIRRRAAASDYHTTEHSAPGTAYTAVAGDMFAIPFEITEPNERYDTWAIWAASSQTGTAVRIGIFSDFMDTGYPDINYQELTAAGALTVTSGTGLKSTTGGGYIWKPDIGFWWLLLKFTTIGAAHTFSTIAGPVPGMPNTSAGDNSVRPAGYKWTGQGTGAFPSTAPTGGVLTNNVPYVAMRRVP